MENRIHKNMKVKKGDIKDHGRKAKLQYGYQLQTFGNKFCNNVFNDINLPKKEEVKDPSKTLEEENMSKKEQEALYIQS